MHPNSRMLRLGCHFPRSFLCGKECETTENLLHFFVFAFSIFFSKASYQYLNAIFPRDFIPFLHSMPSLTLLLIQMKFRKCTERIKLKQSYC